MREFFFGAGASAGTFRGRVPVASAFGATLARLDRNWQTLYPAIDAVTRHLQRPLPELDLETIWTCLDYYSKLEEAIPRQRTWFDEGHHMKRALLRLYGRRCDRLAEKLPLRSAFTLPGLIKGLRPKDLVVSFNYDTIVERIASRCRVNLQTSGVGRRPTKGATLFAKPHGSTAWRMDFRSNTLQLSDASGRPLLDSLESSAVAKGIEPLVLGAVPIKSELIREVQHCWPDVFRTVTSQWRAVIDGLRRAKSVVVVGYSFPPEDQYGQFMLREAMLLRKRARRPKLVVEFYELPGLASERVAAIRRAFGDGIEWPIHRGQVVGP